MIDKDRQRFEKMVDKVLAYKPKQDPKPKKKDANKKKEKKE